MSFNKVKLPGWVNTNIGELVTFHRGVSYKRTDVEIKPSTENIPILRATNIQGVLTLDDPVYVPERLVKAYQKILENDIVIAMSSGSKSIVGKTAQAATDLHAAHGAFCGVARPKTHEVAGFLGYLFKTKTYRDLVTESSKGTSINNLKIDHVLGIGFSLPPVEEQERIVDKIDELFSAIEAGERAIEQARIGVARYRKAILKAAVTGELTKDWRDENPAKESAEDLLARILTARYKSWEKAELAKLDTKGKARPVTEKQWEIFKGKYKPPVEPQANKLSKLPANWIWVSLPQIGEFGRGKSKHRPRGHASLYGGKYPFLQTGKVRNSNGRIRTYDKTYNEKGLAQSRLWPAGTVCITIAANIAETGILEFDACFPDSVVGLIPHPDLGPEYPEFFLRTAKDNLDRYAPATAQKNINLGILETVCVPFPPICEQAEIVDRVEQALSKAAAVEATLDAQSRAAKALKQAVLKTAFEGKLVPQNLNDEPASELLKRIKAAS